MFSLGQMAVDMRGNMLTIRNKALVYFYSKMEDAMKENGKMANSTVKVFFVRKTQVDKAFGCKDKEFNGSMKVNKMKLDLLFGKNCLRPIYIIKN